MNTLIRNVGRLLFIIMLGGGILIGPGATQAAPQRVGSNATACAGVMFFEHIDQGGQQFHACQTTRFATMPAGWNDTISSLATGNGRVLIYEHAGFSGKCRGIGAGEYWGNLTYIPMRDGLNWNDKISSFIVNPSNWEWIRCG